MTEDKVFGDKGSGAERLQLSFSQARAAYHEAAHCVAYYLLGVPFRSVTIEPTLNSQESEESIGHVQNEDWLGWLSEVGGDERRHRVESLLMAAVAGILGERILAADSDTGLRSELDSPTSLRGQIETGEADFKVCAVLALSESYCKPNEDELEELFCSVLARTSSLLLQDENR